MEFDEEAKIFFFFFFFLIESNGFGPIVTRYFADIYVDLDVDTKLFLYGTYVTIRWEYIIRFF